MSASAPFVRRHIGISDSDASAMAAACGFGSVDALIDATVPPDIRSEKALQLPAPLNEAEALAELRATMGRNQVMKSFIGQGYYGTVTPPAILRNILENPGWYTAYTPYQAEISQGRMEALLNFQTMITELTALAVSNASLLDEGTAAAEAAALALGGYKGKGKVLFVDQNCFAQTIAVLKTRMAPLGIEVKVGSWSSLDIQPEAGVFGVVIQYPDATGAVHDYQEFTAKAHAAGAMVIAACDLLALTLLPPPGEWGADIAVGSSQRFGVPMGWGGPHAAFMAVKDDLKRRMPGRLIGVSIDSRGQPALRLSLQTREQHIRREKATSNICTAQVLLAVMASMYAVYHGPAGLRGIAQHVHGLTGALALALAGEGVKPVNGTWFDTLTVAVPGRADAVIAAAAARGINLWKRDADHVSISLDETATAADVTAVAEAITGKSLSEIPPVQPGHGMPERPENFLTQSVFHKFHTEHELLRYLHRLAAKDLTLCDSMISLGSCTMKLNAAAEMLPMSWPEVNALHPFAPAEQTQGYAKMVSDLEVWLAEVTGFAATSLQPNAGSQGEYAGLLAIRAWHRSRGDTQRDVCLIPVSAHGTNPASAVMCGMKVVPVKCDAVGNIDIDDLTKQTDAHAANLAALMITYPSTHGVFEEGVRGICELIHARGGQVYMDGANMNAQVGLTSPGRIGADVCHLNLHKTFCIPHGGGGPGVGPICVAAHLAPHLPEKSGAVCAAPYGSASILTISWMYLRMMGSAALVEATKAAILNANYVASRLDACFPVLYRGRSGTVAHECIIDLRKYKDSAGVSVEDVAKRLIDYGYHSPTMSWPVPGTLMIEPTESESRAELDRFCDAMISIHREIMAVENGEADRVDNVLHHAPHTADTLLCGEWTRPYSREAAAYPDAHTRRHKYWPPVGRVDNVHGDKNLICTCGGVEDFA